MRWRWALVGALWTAAAFGAPRLEPPEVGWDNLVRAGEWNRLRAVLQVGPEGFSGTLRSVFGPVTRARREEAPPFSRVVWESYGFLSYLSEEASVGFTSSDGTEGRVLVSPRRLLSSEDALLIGLVRDAGLLAPLQDRPLSRWWPERERGRMVALPYGGGERLPQSWIGWRSADYLLSLGVPLEEAVPTETHRRAVRRWVAGGGVVILLDSGDVPPPDWVFGLGPVPQSGTAFLPLGEGGILRADGRALLAASRAGRWEELEALWEAVLNELPPPERWQPVPLEDREQELLRSRVVALTGRRLSPARRWALGFLLIWGMGITLVGGRLLRRRGGWAALVILTAAVALLPGTARNRNVQAPAHEVGFLRAYPQLGEARWLGALEAPSALARTMRIPLTALPALYSLTPEPWTLDERDRVVRIELAPNPERPSVWIGEAAVPFVGEAVLRSMEGGRVQVEHSLPLQLDRAAVWWDGRAFFLADLPAGAPRVGEPIQLPNRRYFWTNLELPHALLHFWAREGVFDRYLKTGRSYLVGWARGLRVVGPKESRAEESVQLLLIPCRWEEEPK
ncbi:MAG: hypothetical protein KatS3mg115_0699 [Candidatus Poribacteria bacterium]|nr:MAG: hypothetical protein KatS3mg115_0699 [Candidatus Poribacteria bacterium]